MDSAMWLVVYMAHSPRQAESLEQLLRDEGFLVRQRIVEHGASGTGGSCELMVLKSEAEEARRFLLEKGL